MMPATRNDGLRLQLSGADVVLMRTMGAIAGVFVLAASARNGVGTGQLTLSADGLSWTAPGSVTPGPAQSAPVDGQYMLEDGADPSQWVRLQVYAAYLPDSGACDVAVNDAYNAFGPDDVAAADALAGIVENVTFTLKNVSAATLNNVHAWLDPATANVTISSDGVNFYDPTSELDAHVLSWASIAAGASVNLYLRRTIGAAAASNPKILNLMQFAWTG